MSLNEFVSILSSDPFLSSGQLKSVSDGRTAAPVVDYTYLPDGKVDHSILANGTRTDYGYDGRGLNSSIRTYMSSGQEIWKRDYYRDDRDRIVALQRGSNNGANPMENGRGDHFWYDAEGQLTDGYYGALDPVNNPQGQLRQDHFEYDPVGEPSAEPVQRTGQSAGEPGLDAIHARGQQVEPVSYLGIESGDLR